MSGIEQAEVVVVGGGVIGCAAAYELARDGRNVVLLEQYAVGHARGSSHGPSRIIRLAYDGADYVALARASYALWHELEAVSGQTLLKQVGGLDIGTPDALAMDGIRETYVATGVPYEELSRDEIAHRYPQFNIPEGTVGLYQAEYSLLAADRCVAALAAQARLAGADIREGVEVCSIGPSGEGVTIRTGDGEIHADRVVIAAGSWMRPLLGALGVSIPLRVLKEQLAFFRPANPADFEPGNLPLMIHRFPGTTSLGSVFPIFEHTGVKIMIDRIGPEVEPNDPDRSIDPVSLERLRAYAVDLLPGLTGEVIEAVSCRYTMTPDEDFVIDRHPEHPQIVIVSTCSGHGFKFAVAIGRIIGQLVISGQTAFDISRFRIDRPALIS